MNPLVNRPEVIAFLDASKETPEDDTPRLILADWLEEHGDDSDVARAELSRQQRQLPSLERTVSRKQLLIERQQELVFRYRDDSLEPLQPLLRNVKFQRGLAVVEASAENLVRAAHEGQTWTEA